MKQVKLQAEYFMVEVKAGPTYFGGSAPRPSQSGTYAASEIESIDFPDAGTAIVTFRDPVEPEKTEPMPTEEVEVTPESFIGAVDPASDLKPIKMRVQAKVGEK